MKWRFVLCVALAGAASTGCTQNWDDCREDGSCSCPDALVGDGSTDALPYRFVEIRDFSEAGPEPWYYTTGSDICGMVAVCDGEPRRGISAALTSGYRGDRPSDGEEAPRFVRHDARSAIDDGSRCEEGGAASAFVSLGAGGHLIIDFGVDLRGCTLTVREFPGTDGLHEAYDVNLYQTRDRAVCTGHSLAQARPAEDVTVDIPASLPAY
ncbi:MAG: hypothetical protein H6704_15670 [Myxococcales bacterium]|nr:hypothetical protein [Myxococcales bacterium]